MILIIIVIIGTEVLFFGCRIWGQICLSISYINRYWLYMNLFFAKTLWPLFIYLFFLWVFMSDSNRFGRPAGSQLNRSYQVLKTISKSRNEYEKYRFSSEFYLWSSILFFSLTFLFLRFAILSPGKRGHSPSWTCLWKSSSSRKIASQVQSYYCTLFSRPLSFLFLFSWRCRLSFWVFTKCGQLKWVEAGQHTFVRAQDVSPKIDRVVALSCISGAKTATKAALDALFLQLCLPALFSPAVSPL